MKPTSGNPNSYPVRQQFLMPEGVAKQLPPEAEAQIASKASQMFPSDMFPSEGTQAVDLLSSPSKTGLATMLGTMAGGAGIGAAVPTEGGTSGRLLNALKGSAYAAPLAIIAGMLAWERKNDKNEEIIDTIRRYPVGSIVSKRDLDAKKQLSAKMVYGRGNAGFSDHM